MMLEVGLYDFWSLHANLPKKILHLVSKKILISGPFSLNL